MKAKLKKTYNYLLRFVIIVATYSFLYQQIFIKRDLEEVYHFFTKHFDKNSFLWGGLLVFIMMFVNYGIETLKWRYQIKKIEKVPFFRSFQAVLTGISVSAFLPNRVGDYFGRVFILEKANHIEGILITIVGSISQFVVTVFFGSLGLLLFLPEFIDTSEYLSGYFDHAIITILIISNFLLLLFYFNISIVSGFLQKFTRKSWGDLRRHLLAFSYFNQRELFVILLISASRFLVFTTQFYLLLKLFSISIPYYYGFVLISVIFLLITAIPTIALSEIGVRGSVSIFIIGSYLTKYSMNGPEADLAILSAASILWLINIVLPAIAGTVFVFRLKFFRKNNS